jgi:hypothetical protein
MDRQTVVNNNRTTAYFSHLEGLTGICANRDCDWYQWGDDVSSTASGFEERRHSYGDVDAAELGTGGDGDGNRRNASGSFDHLRHIFSQTLVLKSARKVFDAPVGVAEVLSLVRILNHMSSKWWTFLSPDTLRNRLNLTHEGCAEHEPAPLLSPNDVISQRISGKLKRQMEDPLSLCGGRFPHWCGQLVLDFPFLFPLQVRKQWFKATSLGISAALQIAQQQISESRSANSAHAQQILRLHTGQQQRQRVRVQRDALLESAVKALSLYAKPTSRLEVEFYGEAGTGLGPTLEFFTAVSEALLKRGVFGGMWLQDTPESLAHVGSEIEAHHKKVGAVRAELQAVRRREVRRVDEMTIQGLSDVLDAAQKDVASPLRYVYINDDGDEVSDLFDDTNELKGDIASLVDLDQRALVPPILERLAGLEKDMSAMLRRALIVDTAMGLFPKPIVERHPHPLKAGGGGHGGDAYYHRVQDRRYTPTTPGVQDAKSVVDGFQFLGRLVAKALCDGRLLDVPLSSAFYGLLVGGRLTFDDLWKIYPTMAHSLSKMKGVLHEKRTVEEDGTLSDDEQQRTISELRMDGCHIEDLCLDFTLPGFPHIALKPGGADETVTLANLQEFVDLTIDYYLHRGIYRQMSAFQAGFQEVLPLQCVTPFTARELEVLVCGEETKWTLEDLKEFTKCDHGYSKGSTAMTYLFSLLVGFDAAKVREFLRFVTGSSRLPTGGLRMLQPPLTIVKKEPDPWSSLQPDQYLPSVMTCANYLKLPDYSSQEIMQVKLLQAMAEGQGSFHLS